MTNCGRIQNMVYRSIGMRIQQAREELGLTQQELAAKLGCTQEALSNYELGKRRLYLSSLEQIANTLGKPLSYFTESPAGSKKDEVSQLLAEPQLWEILLAAAELSPDERKLVLDFINWRRSQR
jgi:transcriptional regulator with XRE-family HTH domain